MDFSGDNPSFLPNRMEKDGRGLVYNFYNRWNVSQLTHRLNFNPFCYSLQFFPFKSKKPNCIWAGIYIADIWGATSYSNLKLNTNEFATWISNFTISLRRRTGERSIIIWTSCSYLLKSHEIVSCHKLFWILTLILRIEFSHNLFF